MAFPTYSWNRVMPQDCDQDSPLFVTLTEALRQDQVTLKELIYGTGSYVGDVPHTHLGTEDAAVAAALTQNLINDGCPDDGATAAWTLSGYTTENNKGFLTTTTAGHYAYQVVCRDATRSKAAMGAGADLMVSCFVRSRSTVPTSGEFHFGLSDGGTTFKASCKAVVTAAMLTSSWQRFYCYLPAATSGSFGTSCRLLLKNHATPPNQQLLVTGIAVTIGQALTYWEPGSLESEAQHDDWKKYGLSDCPIFDETVAINSAVAITGT